MQEAGCHRTSLECETWQKLVQCGAFQQRAMNNAKYPSTKAKAGHNNLPGSCLTLVRKSQKKLDRRRLVTLPAQRSGTTLSGRTVLSLSI